jgi:hypothetical protein
MTQLSEHDHPIGYLRDNTVQSLTEELTGAGYGIDRWKGIYLTPFTTSQILSLDPDRKVMDAICWMGVDYPELSGGFFAKISAR